MSLVERSALWVVPAVVIALFMVEAMMQFTVNLLVRPRPRGVQPVDAAELKRRLLALSSRGRPYRVVEGKDCDLTLQWDVVDATWYELFARVKLTSSYRVRMQIDEMRHELRVNAILRTSNWFLGFQGGKPRFNFGFNFYMGFLATHWYGEAYGILPKWPPQVGRVYRFHLDTERANKDIARVVHRSGWGLRPVIWWFQATRRGYRILRALTPAPLRKLAPLAAWGVVYPASYVLFFLYVFAIVGWRLDTEGILVSILITAGWWGIWGLITWALLGFPRFWKRKGARHRRPRRRTI